MGDRKTDKAVKISFKMFQEEEEDEYLLEEQKRAGKRVSNEAGASALACAQRDQPNFQFQKRQKLKEPVIPGLDFGSITSPKSGDGNGNLFDSGLTPRPPSTTNSSRVRSNVVNNHTTFESDRGAFSARGRVIVTGQQGSTSPASSPIELMSRTSPKSQQQKMLGGGGGGRGNTIDAQGDYEFAKQALAKLKTGEDAISFFALHGSNTPVKFLHLNRAPVGKRFRPYDLVIVHPSEVDPEHFTMSAAGVVRIAPGEPSEFLSLAEWMRLSTIFSVITSIRFFKHYLVYKMFHAWRSSIRYNLYSLQRKKLSERLFLAKRSFCEPLLEINRCISEMHHVMLLELRSSKTYEASHFAEHQGQKRAEASKELEGIMEKVQLVVERVCNDATRRARITNEAFQSSIDGMNDPRELKARSLVALKQERSERIQKLKIAMQEAGMLGDFIRLVDYISVENLVGMCINTHKDLLAELLKTSRKSGLFETTVQFTPEREIRFQPNCRDIISLLTELSTSIVRAVGSVSRIIFIRPFKGIVAPLIVDSPDVRNLAVNSKTYRQIRTEMDRKITNDFDEAMEYAQTFEQVLPIYIYNQTFDFEAYKQGELTLSKIKKDMVILSDWTKDLEKMRVGNTVGILYVESRKLRSSLAPITEVGLDRMKGLLAQLARDKCSTLLNEYKTLIRELEAQPSTLKEFAGHVDYVQQLKMDTKEMMKGTAMVEEMYRLCSSYGMKVSSVDMVQFDDLKHYNETFASKRTEAETFIETKMPEMTQTLDMNIAKLGDQLSQLKQVITSGIFVDADADPQEVLEEFETVRSRFDMIKDLSKTYTQYQELFGITAYDYKNLRDVEQVFEAYFNLWTTIQEWGTKTMEWYHKDFAKLDVEQLAQDVQVIFKAAALAHKKLNNQVTERFLQTCTEFKHRVPCILELGNPAMKERHWEQVFAVLKQPYFSASTFTLDNLTDYDVFEHTHEISEISGIASGEAALEASLEKIKLGWEETKFDLLPYRNMKSVFILGGLDDVFTLLEDNQVTLQTMMGSRYLAGVRKDVEKWARKLSLLNDTLDEWVACQRTWMYLETIFCADDIQQQLPEESEKFQMVDRLWKDALLRTKENPFVIECTSKSILGASSKKLPKVLSDDMMIDGDHGNDGNQQVLDEDEDLSDKMFERFQYCNKLLDEVQKSLENYLETKRSAFPRFYFLSNDELLEILSQTRDPTAVQPHLSKCFDSMKSLDFQPEKRSKTAKPGKGDATQEEEDDDDEEEDEEEEPGNKRFIIVGMTSAEGEYVAFVEKIDPNGQLVEHWLLAVERAMKKSLYRTGKDSLESYSKTSQIDRSDWIFSHPAQSIIATDQILWTHNTAKAIMENKLAQHYKFSIEQIDAMIQVVRGPLSKLQRTIIGALIVLDVHARDVVRKLEAREVDSINDFEWTKQLRYYFEEDDIYIKQTKTRFRYSYEYLGNSPRLVITPLTDLCYMTLTGALHLRFGGAPAGPAGTGKTETTKDLAKALAIQCVVFNCSDGLDYKIMGRFFSGLAQCGSWSCFDEFNRIEIEVLSVIAQQILTIQQGISKDLSRIDFEGKSIPLKHSFGVFITMNPGYAGRTELPDNLKALFRPVAMMVPDYRLIAEIILFSEGFSNAFVLSNKMTQLYQLSSQQLSKQDHYDFGMRAVKSVLVAAGNLKRKEPEMNEDLLLIRAMRDSNVPKFLEQDLGLFQGIISDLFPEVEIPSVDYGVLESTIRDELVKEDLIPVDTFVRKVLQVHETQLVRHGMMLVGEASSGKTTNVRILAKALTTLFENWVIDGHDGFFKIVKRFTLNPKSITAGELYGMFNDMTGEWSDGLVPFIVRNCIQDDGERKWIIFDGPVDAVWIENMNTVLDDNKTLCLANSERIKIPASVHMMFEVQDLAVASPATVSRCGMVYMEQIHIGIEAQVEAWAKTVHIRHSIPEHRDRLSRLAKNHIPNGIEYVRKNCKLCIPVTDAHMTESFLKLLTSMLGFQDVNPDHPSLERLTSMLFVFAFAWSIGAILDDTSREKFSTFAIKELAALLDGTGKMDNIFNYFVEPTSAAFLPWSRAVEKFRFDSKAKYFDLLVPTVDTTRYTYLLKMLTLSQRNVLVMGGTGVGKSVIISKFLNEIGQSGGSSNTLEDLVDPNTEEADGDDESKTRTFRKSFKRAGSLRFSRLSNNEGTPKEFISATINYSARTKPSNIVEVLEANLEKKRKTLLGPPSGKRMVLFIDDLNMPLLENYGAQPPNELVRQIIDQGGYYDTQKLYFKSIMDMSVIGACAPPGGGRSELPQRLLRHFHALWMPELGKQSKKSIFEAILGGFLGQEAPKLANLTSKIVNASVDLYNSVSHNMLPTPTRSHYTFNLRDLSKVFQGMLMVKGDHCETPVDLVTLWIHEEARVFRDRLLNKEDRDWFDNHIMEMVKANGLAFDACIEMINLDTLIYGDFTTNRDASDPSQRPYQLIAGDSKEVESLSGLLSDFLEEYNINFPAQMHLVFFQDAIRHICRICRILRQPRGNALLVGVGGSGRQSLTRLASFMAGYDCVSIEMTRGFGPGEFRENLRTLLIKAGCSGPVTFLFSDTQIAYESFLEDINNLLNSGEVPNLYEVEDYEKIVTKLRTKLSKDNESNEQQLIVNNMTRDEILNLYTDRVRENLHIVLAFSPIGSSFRNRCRMFPSLVNCCTIDWFDPWPRDALYSVARFFLVQSGHGLGIEAYVDPLCQMCVHIHKSVEDASEAYFAQAGRHNYTTPTSYLELLRAYKSMLEAQRGLVTDRLHRYQNGLHKLLETEQVVANLETTLKELVPTLEKAQKDTNALLERLAEDQKEADAAREIAMVDEATAKKVAAEVNTIRNECQADLDKAMPAYEEAVKALDLLDKKSIQEVKSFSTPPPLVAFTLEAVCILLGVKADWATAKKVMNDINFLQRLKEFDKDNIDPKKIRKVTKYVKEPDFTAEKMKSVSSAACSLCQWVHAIFIYDGVVRDIAPKRAKLEEAQASLEQVENELRQKQGNLEAIERKVQALQTQYEEKLQNKKDIEARAQKTEVQLERATKLINGLSTEKTRWKTLETKLKKGLSNLVGNMVISCGCIAYLGPFDMTFRSRLLRHWTELCKSKRIPIEQSASNISLEEILGDPVKIRQWHIDGLPGDQFSTENGLLSQLGRRWPLMIDPQGQANKWIRNTYHGEEGSSLKIIKLSDSDFLRTLENAIRFGNPVLLEDVGESLDPTLEPILAKQMYKKGGQLLIRLGDSDVPYNEEFKFFITTKLPNPHYLPEVMIKVTVINFTVTLNGLEDQLLVDVVRKERPELEEKKSELVVSIANDQRALKEIEDKILFMLANSSGDILDDEDLIDELGKSKVTSQAISKRMEETEATTKEINEAREVYRVVAKRGSLLYFTICSLAEVEPIYQYSLQFVQGLFVSAIETAKSGNGKVQERIENLISNVTEKIYLNICRGLFEKDKLLFAIKIGCAILRTEGQISDEEWKLFLLGVSDDEAKLAQENDMLKPQYFKSEPTGWNELFVLSHIIGGVFNGLAKDIYQNPYEWQPFINAIEGGGGGTGGNLKLPEKWDKKLNPFQKLLVIKVFRKEKILNASRSFIAEVLGEKYSSSPPFDLLATYNDSNCYTPIIFILSPGADFKDYIMDVAKDKKVNMVSLGQGQGVIAERLIMEGREGGDWVVLQNCHLAISWLKTLETLLQGWDILAKDGKIHSEFRLWLTTSPSKDFPVGILQNGLKLTNEAPKGIKSNISRVLNDFDEEEYANGSKIWKKLFFSIVFYNALILERRKFGPLGWNISYGWMQSDIKTALMTLKLYLQQDLVSGVDSVPFETLQVLVGDVTYGGRITDAVDKTTNRAILNHFINREVVSKDRYQLIRGTESSYYIPSPEISLTELKNYVENLPRDDKPDVFGLHPNAEIVFNQTEATNMLDTLYSSSELFWKAKEEKETSDKQVQQQQQQQQDTNNDNMVSADDAVVSICEQILEKLSNMNRLDQLPSKAHPNTMLLVDGRVISYGVFLTQEIQRFITLHHTVEATVRDLVKASKGLIVMSSKLEEMKNSFIVGKQPQLWQPVAYPSLMPLSSWVDDFIKRSNFLYDWYVEGPPKSFWLPGFFFPQGIITSVKQVHVRAHKVPIDDLQIRSTVTSYRGPELVTKEALDGIFIHGLFLQGAKFDIVNKVLTDPVPKEMFSDLPVVNLTAELISSSSAGDEGKSVKKTTYMCPLYKTSLRYGVLETNGASSNLICMLDLPIAKETDEERFKIAGAALLCMKD